MKWRLALGLTKAGLSFSVAQEVANQASRERRLPEQLISKAAAMAR